MKDDPLDWSVERVKLWLKSINYDKYCDIFEKHNINGKALIFLDDNDVKDLVKNIGDRKNIFHQIETLKSKEINNSNNARNRIFSRENSVSTIDSIHKLSGYVCNDCLKRYDSEYTQDLSKLNSDFKDEKLKTILSVFYCFLTSLWTSFILAVVHDRVPDMQKYPPLPDLFLDNIPLIPMAFYLTEGIGVILAMIMLFVLFFHKFRFIIARRLFSLSGSIFLLRSITMLITSLSVPGLHLQCTATKYGNWRNLVYRAWEIISGGGLAIQGVRTCGDYMFSGHTVWLTLLTHFICEYTPYTMNWLQTGCWAMNLFGLFFILAAHEHYSIDVFVAFYITSRMFLYYHSLANNKVLLQGDNRRVKIWFPLFSYFEANVHTQIPNQYEKPKAIFKKCLYSIRSTVVVNKKK